MTHCKPDYFEHEVGYASNSLGTGLVDHGFLGGLDLPGCTQSEGSQFEKLIEDSPIEQVVDSPFEQVEDSLIELVDSLFERLGDSQFEEFVDSLFERLGDSQFEGFEDSPFEVFEDSPFEGFVDIPVIPEGTPDCLDNQAEVPGTLLLGNLALA